MDLTSTGRCLIFLWTRTYNGAEQGELEMNDNAQGSWFNTGFEGEHIDDAEKQSKSASSKRFFMMPDETKRILLLDDEPTCIWEHSLKIGGKWRGHEYTCRKGMPDDPRCPLCTSGANRYYLGFLTILDLDGFTGEDGKKYTNLRRLFPMKMETLKRFRKFKERRKSLVGWIIEASRSGKKTANVGDIFDFVEKVDPFEDERFWFASKTDGGKKKPPEIFDYRELFAPVSVKEMMSLGSMSGDDSGGYTGKSTSGAAGGDEDAPY